MAVPIHQLRLMLLGLITVLASWSLPPGSAQETIDPETGLIVAPGWQDVKDSCIRCHTAQIITQNSGNRAVWESRIRWMQSSQGLGDLETAVEDSILSYLASVYGQKSSARRQSLPPALMPTNPYATGSD